MAEPFRVAYVLKRYPRLSETFIVNEMLALQRLGVEVTIAAIKDPEESIVHETTRALKAPIYYLPPKSALASDGLCAQRLDDFSAHPTRLGIDDLKGDLSREDYITLLQASAFAPVLESLGISHIHAHFATAATSAARFMSRLTGIPYSFTAHAKDIFHESVNRRTLAEKIEGARFVVTVSEFNKRYLLDLTRSEGRQGRVIRLYNGVDRNLFRPTATDREPGLVLAVGRLVQKKGFDDLIEACQDLKARARRFHCLIMGEGEEREKLEGMITRHSLGDDVSMPGAKSQTEVIRLMQKAEIFVAPCVVGDDGNRDGLPTAILEAMAVGLPVVSTRVTGIPEIIEDGYNGLLVDERDPRSLSRAIDTLLDSEPLRRRLSAAALTTVRNKFDLSVNAEALKEIFLSARPAH